MVIADIRAEDPKAPVPDEAQRVDGLKPLVVRLNRLYRAVDGADGAPSADARAGHAAASSALERQLSALHAVQDEAALALKPS